MALERVNYEDGKTVITAKNLNAIQDEIISNREDIDELMSQASGTTVHDATVE